jgi:hypothetical protein
VSLLLYNGLAKKVLHTNRKNREKKVKVKVKVKEEEERYRWLERGGRG